LFFSLMAILPWSVTILSGTPCTLRASRNFRTIVSSRSSGGGVGSGAPAGFGSASNAPKGFRAASSAAD
jgi:hypothetical protein